MAYIRDTYENKRDLINIECRGGGWLYLSVNVYKIIAIIVLIPRDDDAYTMPENGNQMAVSPGKKRGGGEGVEMENARVAGRMKY